MSQSGKFIIDRSKRTPLLDGEYHYGTLSARRLIEDQLIELDGILTQPVNMEFRLEVLKVKTETLKALAILESGFSQRN